LWGRHFIIRTNHYSLKFLLDQRLSTVPQHQWISKLFGYDFDVMYRPGRLNVIADALSRRDTEEGSTSFGSALCVRSGPSFTFIDDIRRATSHADDAKDVRRRFEAGELQGPWRIDDGLLLHGNRIYVPGHANLRHQALSLAHSAGHEGMQKTLHRLRADFYIPGDRALVRDLVRTCTTCQRNKTATSQPAGLLQPLEVPSQVWADISIDFIEGLPKVGGKSLILTVVDRFSKYAHFIALGHPYTATTVARAFFEDIVRLHSFPSSIVSDRDPVFTGHVWRDLFGMVGVKLHMSTAFHPQTDDQSEVVNKVLAMYLRCVTGDRPRAWFDWLAWAEYCYNTSFHTALRATPFEVVYGRSPRPSCPIHQGQHGQRRLRLFYAVGTRYLLKLVNVFFKPSRCPRNTTMPTTTTWSMLWETGFGCVCCTERRSPWTPVPSASLGRAMRGHFKWWNTSAASPTVYSFRTGRASMTFST
jgi:hypothetical protein